MKVVVACELKGESLDNVLFEFNGIVHAWHDKIKAGQVIGSSEKPMRCLLKKGEKFYLAETRLDN
jgi:hypothetical protein